MKTILRVVLSALAMAGLVWWISGDSSLLLSLVSGQVAGTSGWVELLQPTAATLGLAICGLLVALAIGVPLGVLWGRWLPVTRPVGVLAVVLRSFPAFGLALWILHVAVVREGWVVPAFLMDPPERGASTGGVGIAGRYLLAALCIAPALIGEFAWQTASAMGRVSRTVRIGYARALGLGRGAILHRWIIPPALLFVGRRFPITLAWAVGSAAFVEWVFRLGGLGRLTIQVAIEGDRLGALLGVLVLGLGSVVTLAGVRGLLSRWPDAGRSLMGSPLGSKRLVPVVTASRSWRVLVLGAAVYLALVPVLPTLLGALLPIQQLTDTRLEVAAVLGESPETTAGFGRTVVRGVISDGYRALWQTLISASMAVFGGLVIALLPRLFRNAFDLVGSTLLALPAILLPLAVLADSLGAPSKSALLFLHIIACLPVMRQVDRWCASVLGSQEVEASVASGRSRLRAYASSFLRGVGERLPLWTIYALAFWVFVPAALTYAIPELQLSVLGASARDGFRVILEYPSIALAPICGLWYLGVAFGLARVLLPGRYDDELPLR